MSADARRAVPTERLEGGVSDPRPIDGVLLVSFGGPRGPGDVMPFLEKVTAGRGVPRERLELVAEHYLARGGVSPINAETEALVARLREELASRGRDDVGVYLGNRNWPPLLGEALEQAAAEGRRHLAVVLTSAYSGYSSCRQYRENVAEALTAVAGQGGDTPQLSFVRPWGLEPEVVSAWARLAAPATRAALDALGAERDEEQASAQARLVFVAHSIPESAARTAGPPGNGGAYVREVRQVCAQVAALLEPQVGARLEWSLAYCSRSGPPSVPWLEPDISDELAALAGQGVRSVACVPVGFVADHMEVAQDLDTVAAADAARLGIAWHRAPTLRDDPQVAARLTGLALAAGESPAVCPAGCCAPIGRPGAPPPERSAAFEGP